MQTDNNLVQDSKAAVLAALEQIGARHGADFVSIWPFMEEEEGPAMRRQYLWCRMALAAPEPLELQHNIILDNRGIHDSLIRNIPIAGTSSSYPDLLPVIGPATQAFIMIPVILHQSLWGVIMCEFLHSQPFLADALTSLMESAVHIAAVLQRKQDIERLSAVYDEYRTLLDKPGTRPGAENSSPLLLDKLPEGVFTLDTAHHITYISPYFSKIKGFNLALFQEKITLAMQALPPDNDIPEETPAQPDTESFFTLELETPVSARLILEIHTAPLPDESGLPHGHMCIARDITRQHLARQQQRQREIRRQHLMAHISDVLCCYDSQGIITFASESLRDAFGYDPEEIIGKPLADLIHPDFHPGWTNHLLRLNRGEGGVSEYQMRKADGSRHWVRLRCKPVFDEGGRLLEVITIIINIDDYKKIEQDFQESEQAESVYQQIIEQMPSLVWVVDTQLITTYVSPSITQVLGYTQEEALGMEMGLILKRDSFKLMIEAFDEALAAAKDKDKTWFKDLEIWQKRSNGRIIKGSLRISLLFKEDQHIGILGITTMRKKAGKIQVKGKR